ncbi:UNKNOWN [Stylonychia lemnae]|uniref:Uncharacterized protein n=1 Tax=Stylonychia lemnae TaxID=5949 RepID=A0A078AEB8_STYLE|nr:UNKNOWN [Stylonychia lemnae]|eukprot:CDW79263.1 UNKNOWN [Stylonychia lemnae]
MNSFGGFTCYMVSKLFLSEIVHGKLKDQFQGISSKVNEHSDNLFFYLTFLRIFPGSPNWLMNISFAHIEAIKPYQVFFSIFIGLMPWNFFTCQGGQILSEIKSKSDVIKPETYMQLIGFAVVCLIPPLIKKFFIKEKAKVE